MVFELPEMDDSNVGSGESVEDVGNNFGGRHLLDVVLDVSKVHEFETLDSVSGMELLLSFMEPADHEYVDFVVLADVIFTFFDSFDKLLLEFLVAFSGGESVFRKRELHESLVEEDSGEEVKLFFADD